MSLKLILLSLMTLASPMVLLAPHGFSQSQSPSVLKKDSMEYREMMETISRQLGVTCTTCHNTNNFAESKKREFAIAKEHLRIVQVLIDAGMDGRNSQPKADCYMCHRGELKPAYREKIDPLVKPLRRLKPSGDLSPEAEDPE